MKISDFINQLRTHGRYSFTIQEAEKALELNKVPTLNALRRFGLGKHIVSPAKGFYLIVPPEYQALGCLPAEMFVPNLMKYLGQSYYVGFLSAAQYYGAAHQKPQRFQVVISGTRRPIKCNRIYIEFIADKNVVRKPTKQFNTASGKILVASPETLAADLVTSPQHAAGINNVTTILMELAESINVDALIELTKINQKTFWLQRLGYLLEQIGAEKLANSLHKILNEKKLHWVKLVPQKSYTVLQRNSKWKIIVNSEVEADK